VVKKRVIFCFGPGVDQGLNQPGNLSTDLHDLVNQFGPGYFTHNKNRRLALDFEQIAVGDNTADLVVGIPNAKVLDILLHHFHQSFKYKGIG